MNDRDTSSLDFTVHTSRVTVGFKRLTAPYQMNRILEVFTAEIIHHCECSGATHIGQIKCFAVDSNRDMVTYRTIGTGGQPKIIGQFEGPSEMMRIVVFIFLNGLEPGMIENIVNHAAEHAARQAGTVTVEDLSEVDQDLNFAGP